MPKKIKKKWFPFAKPNEGVGLFRRMRTHMHAPKGTRPSPHGHSNPPKGMRVQGDVLSTGEQVGLLPFSPPHPSKH